MSGLRPARPFTAAPAHRRADRALPRTGRRWLLLGVALIGVLALHALSAHDSAGHHRAVASSAADPTLGAMSAAAADGFGVSAAPADSPAGDGHAVITGCVLLLLAAAVLLLPNRQTARRPSAVSDARSGRFRGPPRILVRLTLCVDRI